MNSVQIKELTQKLQKFATTRLADGNVGTELLSEAAAGEASVGQGSIQAVFGASITASVHLYNDAGDRDEDGIVGNVAPVPDAKAASIDWRPQIGFVPGQAWLKYALTASATAKASLKIGMAGGSLAGDRTLRLLHYRCHPASGSVGSAVVDDLAALASPLSVSDIRGLGVHEATAMKVRGSMTGQLKLTWSDVFSGSLGGLARVAGLASGDAWALDLPASAQVTFAFGIEDDFTLCFKRTSASAARPYQVALRKSVTHDRRFGAKAGIRVEFANPDAVRQVLMTALSGLLQAPTELLQKVDQATSLDQVDAAYRPYVGKLLERFGIEDPNPLAPLQQKLQALQKDLTGRIEALATRKVELGLEYEYLRIGSEASLMEASLSDAALARLHAPLLALDLRKVLADQNSDSGFELAFFLHEKTDERVRAWGFSLGAGTWINLKSTQKRRKRFIERRYVAPDGQWNTQAFLGSTQYTGKVNTWSADYGATLKADLAQARPLLQTGSADFKCGLHLWWEESRISTAKDLDRIVDDALLWGVIDAAAAPALRDRLALSLAGAATCKPRLSLMLGDHGTRLAARLIAACTDADWCRHAARALPWSRLHEGRATPAIRESLYLPFFRAYQRSPLRSPAGLRNLVADSLRAYGGGMAAQERKGETPWTTYRVLYEAGLAHGFDKPLARLRDGAGWLAALRDGRGDFGEFDDAFRLMCDAFEQTYRLRMVASLLGDLRRSGQIDGEACQATLTVSYTDKDEEAKDLVVGGGD